MLKFNLGVDKGGICYGVDLSSEGRLFVPEFVHRTKGTEPIGKYGMLRKTYLKEHRSGWYQSMLATGELSQHLSEIDKTAQRRVEQVVSQLLARNPAPDRENDPLSWAGHMNNLLAMAEEMVLADLIYQ